MTFVSINKGFDLRIKGKPSSDITPFKNPEYVAILPERIPFIKPKLAVNIGDAVNIGTLLFYDKRHPDIKYLSPGGGIIENIRYGPRRIVQAIIIKLDASEAYESFDPVSKDDLEQLPREELVSKLMAGGVWPLLRELPFRDTAPTDKVPPCIIISLYNEDPFHPQPAAYLKGKEADFQFGIKVVEKLSGNKVFVAAPKHCSTQDSGINAQITHYYSGPYPAGDPGVMLYHLKRSPSENRAWYINGQDLLLIAQLLQTGRYPIERIMAFSGKGEQNNTHIKTRIGVPLHHIAKNVHPDDSRCIVGGLFKGYTSDIKGYMGWLETSLLMIPEGNRREFLGFLRPGLKKHSYSRTFLSYFNSTEFDMDCNAGGGERACIACGYCVSVCPVDILPQLTYKAILAEDVDEYLSHGLLDCVECGLCSYVCPSKIELSLIFKNARNAYYKEQA